MAWRYRYAEGKDLLAGNQNYLFIIQTATFGLVVGAKIAIPHGVHEASKRDEWLIVLGGSGMVGRSAVQVLVNDYIAVLKLQCANILTL